MPFGLPSRQDVEDWVVKVLRTATDFYGITDSKKKRKKGPPAEINPDYLLKDVRKRNQELEKYKGL